MTVLLAHLHYIMCEVLYTSNMVTMGTLFWSPLYLLINSKYCKGLHDAGEGRSYCYNHWHITNIVRSQISLSVRSDYEKTFRVRGAQLFNLLPADLRSIASLDSFKVGLTRFLEQYSDTLPVSGYTTVNDNSPLSLRRTHPMPLSSAWPDELLKTYQTYVWHSD